MKDDVSMLAEIYDMQADLNRKTLGNINVDWDEILCSAQGDCPLAAEEWLENYRKALSAEFVEYLASDKTTKNAKIEVVDILHFLVSLAEIVGIPPFRATECVVETEIFRGVALSRAMLVTLDDLQNAIPYKWWGTGATFKLDMAQVAVEDLFCIFGIIMGEMNMDWASIYDLYKKKNAVNHQRQDNGYDLSKKTEEDNEAIIVALETEPTVSDSYDSPKFFDYEEECRSEVSPEEVVSPDGEMPEMPPEIPPGPSFGNMMMIPCTVPSGLVAISPMIYEPEDSDAEE